MTLSRTYRVVIEAGLWNAQLFYPGDGEWSLFMREGAQGRAYSLATLALALEANA